MPMQIIRVEEQHGVGLRIEGDLDIRSVAEVRAALCEEITGDGAVTLDASGVDACDAAGLQLLCSALNAKEGGPRVSLVRLSSAVRQAAEAIGMKLREGSPDGL